MEDIIVQELRLLNLDASSSDANQPPSSSSSSSDVTFVHGERQSIFTRLVAKPVHALVADGFNREKNNAGWWTDNDTKIKKLKGFVNLCLAKCEKNPAKTIAYPAVFAGLIWYYKNRDNIQNLSDEDKEKMSSISVFVHENADWVAGILTVATLYTAHKIDAKLQPKPCGCCNNNNDQEI
ncbi:MAG: hypothetical protein WCT20_01475 [Candidatus Babeliales bacterium]